MIKVIINDDVIKVVKLKSIPKKCKWMIKNFKN